MGKQEEIQSVANAVESGAIAKASYAQLVSYSALLTTSGARLMMASNFDEVSKIVHLHLTRSVIEAFERRSKVQGWAVVVFAVITIVATLMPYFIAPSPSVASSQVPTALVEPPNKPQAQNKLQSSAPTPPTAQTSSPEIKMPYPCQPP